MGKFKIDDVDITLAYVVADAFDGDDVHGKRVRSLAAVLAVVPGMSSRSMVRWIHETTGRRLSQSTVTRALSVASAVVAAGYPVASSSDDVTRTLADLVRIRTLSGTERLTAVLESWDADRFTLETFADYVADAYAADDAARTLEDAKREDAKRESRRMPATDGGVDDGSGAGQDMTRETVGGGDSADVTAERAAATIAAIAGDITAGRIAPTDELVAAAQAVIRAAADVAERAAALTAETPLSVA